MVEIPEEFRLTKYLDSGGIELDKKDELVELGCGSFLEMLIAPCPKFINLRRGGAPQHLVYERAPGDFTDIVNKRPVHVFTYRYVQR